MGPGLEEATPEMDPTALHGRAIGVHRRLVDGIRDDQWQLPTPCAEWDVRALVDHTTGEHRWVPPLVAGRTVEDATPDVEPVSDDEDTVSAHHAAADAAQTAFEAPGALGSTIHLSFGDVDGRFYCLQRTADLVIHAWDLATATGQHLDDLDAELVKAAYDVTAPNITPEVRAAGVFGPEVEVPADSDTLTKLLGVTGRDPSRG